MNSSPTLKPPIIANYVVFPPELRVKFTGDKANFLHIAMKNQKYYHIPHPTNTILTGTDIIFNNNLPHWVAIFNLKD